MCRSPGQGRRLEGEGVAGERGGWNRKGMETVAAVGGGRFALVVFKDVIRRDCLLIFLTLTFDSFELYSVRHRCTSL